MARVSLRWRIGVWVVFLVEIGLLQTADAWAKSPSPRPVSSLSRAAILTQSCMPNPSNSRKPQQLQPAKGRESGAKKRGRKASKKRHLMMWTVRGRYTTHTLLGSIHILPKGFFPLDPKIERAFQQAVAIAVEADIHNINVVSATWQILQLGTYCGINPFCSASLRDDVSPALLERLQRELPRFGLQLSSMMRFKPWFLAITLQGQMLQRSGISQDGIDQHFLKKASARKIPILQLESLQEQLTIFDQLPPRLQTQMLVSSLEEKEFHKGMQTILRLWKQGDPEKLAEKLAEDSKKDPDARLTYMILLDQRNVRMTQKIIGFLREQKKPYFIIVGAAHFVGKNSIIDLLQRAGFKPKQVRASRR